MNREEIEKTIIEFKKKIPVRIYKLARELGLEVYKTTQLPEGFSGCIYEEDGSYVILTNKKDHIHRRRFTVAHELAHFILHRDQIGDGIVDDGLYRSKLSGPLEREANAYAADILMPMEDIIKAIDDGANSVSELAEKFYVSEAAMSIRIGIP